ncbi:hypothetical protein EDC96DRAFT_219367 [Choanephora cucurbitarum]|nr:hypothetical protein EDC96DRAFT_219367 [Choanephora cucurbitarum]
MLTHKNLPPWLLLSYILSQHLVQKEYHKRYLSAIEQTYFLDALISLATWIAFITLEGKGELNTTAFRVRSMLYEQMIPHLFQHKACCKHIDLASIAEQARLLHLPHPSEITSALEQYKEAHVKKEEEPEPIQTTVTEEGEEEANVVTTSDIPATTNNREEIQANDQVPLMDVFHTLELDMAAMIEQRKLEEFEAQEELNEAEEARENAAKSLQIFNADGNFNLKYLLQGIVANRQKTSLSDRELQNLLSDFKPHRSKWSNDDRVGQEELYEACEKVLTDLKNYTEHSTPFLNKVNKREAPDYFDVIEKPMDLGTVTKKMKNLAYRSKKEFADDLYLIYENCLAYNTTTGNEYRKHAIAMRRKTERLLSRVPNISIKETRPENEEEVDFSEEEEEPSSVHQSRKSTGKHRLSIHERTATPVLDRQSRERSMTRGSSVMDHQSDIESTPEPNNHRYYGGKHVQKNQSGYLNLEEQQEEEEEEESKLDDGEFGDQVWREKTKKTRARLTTDVEKQYQFPFSEREALVRSSMDMERFTMMEHLHDHPESVMRLMRVDADRFLQWTDRRSHQASLLDEFDLDSSDDENLDAFFSRKMTKPDKTVDDAVKTDLFLPSYAITSGLPEIDGLPEDLVEPVVGDQMVRRKSSVDLSPETLLASQGYSSLSFDLFPELDFPDYGLNPLIDKSNAKLNQIRRIYAKCNAVRNNMPLSLLKDTNDHSLVPTKTSYTTEPLLAMNGESGHQMAQKVLSKLLLHAGFEGAKTGALNVLTDIMIDFLVSIGKTMRSYWDDYGHQMHGDEMVSHSLYENGILDISELEEYVHDDIERGMQRLDDLHRRLQTSYQDLLSGPMEKSIEDEEELLNEEETFITGIFGEDLGEDYFGFKDIGLDQEYSINALQIPSHLWFGKSKDKAPIKSMAAKEPSFRFTPPPSFVPVTSEKAFVGLLQPYFAQKLPLIEDEFIPNRNKNRPRYPPTNKVTANRKKLGKDLHLGAGADHKKYKRKRPAEEIVAEKAEKAEKKRLKMEEKAQRIAEKEQKRRMREELREQEKQARIEAKEKKKLLNKKTKQPKNNVNTQSVDSSSVKDEEE